MQELTNDEINAVAGGIIGSDPPKPPKFEFTAAATGIAEPR